MDKIRIKIPQNATEFQKQRVQALKDFVRQYLQGKNHKAIRDRLEAKAVHLFSMDTRVPIHWSSLAEAERMFGFTWAGWVVLRIQFGTYNMAWSWTGSQYQAAFPGEDLTKPMPSNQSNIDAIRYTLNLVPSIAAYTAPGQIAGQTSTYPAQNTTYREPSNTQFKGKEKGTSVLSSKTESPQLLAIRSRIRNLASRVDWLEAENTELKTERAETKEKLKSLSEDLGEVQARFSAFMDGMQAMSRQSGSRKSGGGQPPAKRQRAEKE